MALLRLAKCDEPQEISLRDFFKLQLAIQYLIKVTYILAFLLNFFIEFSRGRSRAQGSIHGKARVYEA